MVLAVVLVVVGFGSLAGALLYGSYMMGNQQAALQQSQFPQGMMGGYTGTFSGFGGMMGTQTGMVTNGESVTIAQAMQMMQQVPSYAKVFASNNTVVFGSSGQFNVFVLALMPDKAVNITGRPMPNYATDDVFVIYGLINPTLVMRSGASVQFTVVNLDDDMYHNLVVSQYGPPYNSMPMQTMMSGNWMPFLPPANYNTGSAHEFSYSTSFNQTGTLWYLCTYPDHAQTGMYGKIIITN